ncbi:hypothetical protein LPJ66_011780, partial [Kickxella alabastrina]
MAAHTSSLVTRTTSSMRSLATRKHSRPTWHTAVPSANRPTSDSTSLRPAFRDCAMAQESTVSTATILIAGQTRLTYAEMPAISPPPPTATKIMSISVDLRCRKSSIAIVPWPAITRGSSKGGMLVSPWSFSNLLHSTLASSNP